MSSIVAIIIFFPKGKAAGSEMGISTAGTLGVCGNNVLMDG